MSLSDEQKLELRPALARVHGALLRAWQLGMFVPTTEADEELLRNTRQLVVSGEPYARGDVASDLAPLSDEEYLAVFDGLFARFRALASAYRRGTSTPLAAVTTIPQPRRRTETWPGNSRASRQMFRHFGGPRLATTAAGHKTPDVPAIDARGHERSRAFERPHQPLPYSEARSQASTALARRLP